MGLFSSPHKVVRAVLVSQVLLAGAIVGLDLMRAPGSAAPGLYAPPAQGPSVRPYRPDLRPSDPSQPGGPAMRAMPEALEFDQADDAITIAGEIAPGDMDPARAKFILTPLIVAITAVGSAFVDNIVFVSTFIPIIKKIVAGSPEMSPLWWALLFGACFGGNITAIGSTANLVAISMLGKKYSIKVAFLEWLKVGILVGLVSCAVAVAVVLCYFKTPAPAAEPAPVPAAAAPAALPE